VFSELEVEKFVFNFLVFYCFHYTIPTCGIKLDSEASYNALQPKRNIITEQVSVQGTL
jgi:hypothetical protein